MTVKFCDIISLGFNRCNRLIKTISLASVFIRLHDSVAAGIRVRDHKSEKSHVRVSVRSEGVFDNSFELGHKA